MLFSLLLLSWLLERSQIKQNVIIICTSYVASVANNDRFCAHEPKSIISPPPNKSTRVFELGFFVVRNKKLNKKL